MTTRSGRHAKSGWCYFGMIAALAACTGPAGPPGPEGAAGEAGPRGPEGPPGQATTTPDARLDSELDGGVADALDELGPMQEAGESTHAPPGADGGVPDEGGALRVSCLGPCHGFGGIVEQWKTSRHYSAYISNLGGPEVASWTGAQPCGNCHAVDGIELRVAGQIATAGDAAVAHLAHGELNYASSSGAATEPRYTGNAQVAEVGCVTCHDITNANDPHVTGKDYTKGTFPQRVPAGQGEVAYIEKSPDKSAVVGTSIGPNGGANTCAWCHKSRKDVTSFIGPNNVIANSYWGPHDGPQTDIFSGLGGYHFAGMTYGTSTHQQKLTCVDCHMPEVATNGGFPDHSFAPQLGACQSCHAGATSFDVLGGQSAVKAAMFELERVLNDAGLLTRSSAAPYGALSTDELADGQFNLDNTRPGAGADGGNLALDADRAGALYDYFLVARGGALGVHNPKYVRQLVFDSYLAFTGKPPTTLVRPQ